MSVHHRFLRPLHASPDIPRHRSEVFVGTHHLIVNPLSQNRVEHPEARSFDTTEELD